MVTGIFSIVVSAINGIALFRVSKKNRLTALELESFKSGLQSKNQGLDQKIDALKRAIEIIQAVKERINKLIMGRSVWNKNSQAMISKLEEENENFISYYKSYHSILDTRDREYFHSAKNISNRVYARVYNCYNNPSNQLTIDDLTRTFLTNRRNDLVNFQQELQSSLSNMMFERYFNGT